MTDAKKVEYIVVSKFAHFKPNDKISFDPENVPSAAIAHIRLLGESEDKSEGESLSVLKGLYESIVGKPAGRTGPVKLSAGILEFLAKDKAEDAE